jgi:hypothetical protein
MSKFTDTEFYHSPDLKKFTSILKNLKRVFDFKFKEKYGKLEFSFPYMSIAKDQSMYKNTLYIGIDFQYSGFNKIRHKFLEDLDEVLTLLGVSLLSGDEMNWQYIHNNKIMGINMDPIEYFRERNSKNYFIVIDNKGNIIEESQNKYNGLPFEQKNKDGKNIRTFSNLIKEEELKWHFDDENRIIKPLNETDWSFQMDDHIPIRLEKGKKILIPEGKYHRLIKGTGNLTLEVKFIKTKKKNP